MPGQHWSVGQVSQSHAEFHGMPSRCGSPRSQSHSITSAAQVSVKWKPAHQESLEVGSELKPVKQAQSSNTKSVTQRGTQLHIFLECAALKRDSLFWVWGGSSTAAVLSYLPSYQQQPLPTQPSYSSQVTPSCFLPGNSASSAIFSDNHLGSSDTAFLILAAFNSVSNTHLPKC